jgi:hypothetical protein
MTKFPFMTFNAVVGTLQKEVRESLHDSGGVPRGMASRVPDAECKCIADLVAWARTECHAIGLLAYCKYHGAKRCLSLQESFRLPLDVR